MSGLSDSMPPRSVPTPDRPPVENWMIMPGQWRAIPACTAAKRSGFGGRRLIVIADMDMDEAGAGLVGLVRCLDLLRDGDRNRRIILLARQRSGDRHGDDAG